MIEQIFPPQLTHALGWTLIHALWQGAAFALLLGLLLVLLRRFSPRSRYLVSIGLLTAFLVSAGVTFSQLYNTASTSPTIVSLKGAPDVGEAAGAEINGTAVPTPGSYEFRTDQVQTEATSTGIGQQMRAYFDTHLPVIVTLWLLGVLIMQLRFLGQLAYVQRLRHYGVSRFPAEWAATIQELEEKIGVKRHVRYLISQRVNSPLTVGWLKPAILFPPELLAELRQREIVSILAHELAHVRRHDYVVGIVQSLINTLFFFHPGVWWMNARIGEEREHCCDDLAVAATGKRVGYAKTLVELQARQLVAPNLAMAAGGGNSSTLATRIHRLVGGAFTGATFNEGIMTGLILCVAGYLALFPAQLEGIDRMNNQVSAAQAVQTEKQVTPPTLPASMVPTDKLSEIAAELPTNLAMAPNPINPAPATAPTIGTERTVNDSELDLLLLAIREGRSKSVKLFIERGVDVNARTKDLNSPLFTAVNGRRTQIIELLLSNGANPDLTGPNGWTPLMKATSDRYTKGMSLLLKGGARADFASPGGWTAAREAAKRNCTTCLDILRKAGANVSSNDLAAAVKAENAADVARLLKAGADPDQLLEGHPVLGIAAHKGNFEIVALLLKAGADINLRDHHNKSALELAVSHDHTDVAEQLLNAGASTETMEENCECEADGSSNSRTKAYRGYESYEGYPSDQSTDEWPSWAGMAKTANILADQNITSMVYPFRDGKDQVINYYASAPEVLRSVRSSSADPLIAEIKAGMDLNEGGDRVTFRINTKKVDLSKITFLTDLKPSQFDVHIIKNWTPLMDTAERGYAIAVKLLLDSGADVSIKNSDGKTALDVAVAAGNEEVARMLRR
ncbi:ankyrin repeat domain-containing protein [Neolewinella antarctica]|uniref:Ankyrin repeat protein/beta-lactamase regulating signal transducer with metallopeptidase domain n=1 Tax=Neolewinella antarctica TaxID=442734 RepID=A0ABX0X962_9BACT|nr:ankyrin repeat domain-containing protein [Neolewinella antarctica]NJC25801.1 ankyrin repeat protein/beta-lactamase regulating signal transducer with metallopeptidase domain [Neolewinella antarctica]